VRIGPIEYDLTRDDAGPGSLLDDFCQAMTMVIDERASGSTVHLHIGAELELRLDENPTTGFRWSLDASGAPAVAVSGDRYDALAPGVAGAGGVHVWQFAARHAGAGRVELSYRRRFGGTVGRTFVLNVEVEPAA
jgi:inhibitor of cysteine peptidase